MPHLPKVPRWAVSPEGKTIYKEGDLFWNTALDIPMTALRCAGCGRGLLVPWTSTTLTGVVCARCKSK